LKNKTFLQNKKKKIKIRIKKESVTSRKTFLQPKKKKINKIIIIKHTHRRFKLKLDKNLKLYKRKKKNIVVI
jgi:hypothetical protein